MQAQTLSNRATFLVAQGYTSIIIVYAHGALVYVAMTAHIKTSNIAHEQTLCTEEQSQIHVCIHNQTHIHKSI